MEKSRDADTFLGFGWSFVALPKEDEICEGTRRVEGVLVGDNDRLIAARVVRAHLEG